MSIFERGYFKNYAANNTNKLNTDKEKFIKALTNDIATSHKKPIEIIKSVLKNNKLARVYFRKYGIDEFLPQINNNIEVNHNRITSEELAKVIDSPLNNLNEISLQATSSKDLEDKEPEKVIELMAKYDGIEFYKTKNFKNIGEGLIEIFSGKEYLGKLNLGYIKKYNLPEIDQVFLNSNARGKGIAEKIYSFILDTYGGIVSGYIQTPGSKKLWVKLANKYNVYIEDGKGNFYECEVSGDELKAPVKIYGNINVMLCFKITPDWVYKKLKQSKVKPFVENILRDAVKNYLNEAENGKFKYAIVKANVDLPEMKNIHSKIKKEDVYQDEDNTMGLEDNPHVTLLYGLHKTVTVDDVKKAIENLELPTEIIIKGISKFENDNFDVLKFDVEKKGLDKINSALRELPYTNKYDDYKPHLTIAYLKKGKADEYIKKIEDISKNKNIKTIDFVEVDKKKHKLN